MALQTLDLLEARLQRLQYLSHGDVAEHAPDRPIADSVPIASRMQALEKSFEQLKNSSDIVRQLLRTRMSCHYLC